MMFFLAKRASINAVLLNVALLASLASADDTAPTVVAQPYQHYPDVPYEQREAQLKAFYAKSLPTLPAGMVEVIDQPYVAQPHRGVSPDSSQTLDLFVPSGGGPFPLVVWVHGGGWHAAGKDSCFELCRPFLNHGFACASLDYRWTWDAPFPAQIEDCNDAIAWLRANAAQYHLDPNEVGLIGHSAGAHLCALIAATGDSTTFKDPQKVQAAVCLSGIYDMDRARGQWPADSLMTRPHDVIDTFFPTGTYDTAFARYASPESYVHPGIPPLLIFHGSLDSIVPIAQAQVFAEDLTKAGVDATFRIGIGQTHGSVLSPDNMAATVSFFEQHLRQHADP